MNKIFLLLIISLHVNILMAQSNIVDLNTPDQSRLQAHTFEAVNQLRTAKKLKPLQWDLLLHKAATDHAQYLIKEKKLTHYQREKEKRTPLNRVKIYGGIAYELVGENIAETTLGIAYKVKSKQRNTVTYSSTGNTFAQQWRFSPPHYKNILNKEYNVGAIGIAYDSTTQRCIAVQVFGKSNGEINESQQPDLSSDAFNQETPKLPYKLKKYKYKRKREKLAKDFLRLDIGTGYLTGNYKKAKKIFRGRRAGIGYEMIHISQYDSNSTRFAGVPNRRNGRAELNGDLLEPIYRKRLLKTCRKIAPKKYLIKTSFIRLFGKPTMFIYPLIPNSKELEYNLFYIKNKRLTTHRTYIMVPSKMFDTLFPQPTFTQSFKPLKREIKYRTDTLVDTVQFRIYYASGQVLIDSTQQKEISEAFNTKKGEIIEVRAAAHASIEGDEASNKKLVYQRMKEVMKLIKPRLSHATVKPKIKMKEQWRLFRQQIPETEFAHLLSKSKQDIREYVNLHKKDSSLAKMLNDQRFTDIQCIWRQEVVSPLPQKSNAYIYDSLLSKYYETIEKPSHQLIKKMELTLISYYDELIQKDSIPVKLVTVPHIEKHPELKYHELMFKLVYLKSISETQFFENTHRYQLTKNFPKRLRTERTYNNLIIVYHEYLKGRLDYLLEDPNCAAKIRRDYYFKTSKKYKCNDWKDNMYLTLKSIPHFIKYDSKYNGKLNTIHLWKYYYLYLIQYYITREPFTGQEYNLLRGFKRYYHPVDSVLTDTQRLKYAYFYCVLLRYKTAKALIEPMALRDEPHKEALKLYITLMFDSFDDTHEYNNYLISQFKRLGKEEWCDLWKNPNYLNFILLEDLNLKNFYNCNCDR